MVEVSRKLLPPVAGIPILHECEAGITLSDRADVKGGDTVDGRPVLIRHRVAHVDITAMSRIFTVVNGLVYLSDAEGNTAVSSDGVDGGAPRLVLTTERPGIAYVANYSHLPRGPVSPQAVEISAYTLALASRQWGLMAHGCGLVLPNGAGALCLGVSGAGKSTLGRMMLRRPAMCVLNDDRNVLTGEGTTLRVWATPWPGNAGIGGSGSAPLRAVAFITRSTVAYMSRLGARDALPRLLRTSLLPAWSLSDCGAEFDLIEKILQSVPIVELGYPLLDSTPEWIENRLLELAA